MVPGTSRFRQERDQWVESLIELPRWKIRSCLRLSIFTHLATETERFWADELTRVIRPGGYLLITLHGDSYRQRFSKEQGDLYDQGQVVVVSATWEGTNRCATYHPESYVRTRMFPAS